VTGEQLLNDVMVNELPTTTTEDTSADNSSSNTDPVIHAALLARIEMLEAENKKLKVQLDEAKHSKKAFRLEDIQCDDRLVCFYTGFTSFRIFEAFYEFLGPATEHLTTGGKRRGNIKENGRDYWILKISYS